MAFGKNPATMSAVGSFRQLSGKLTKNNYDKSKGKGGIPYFVDMYQPSTDFVDTIRLVAGEYLQDEVVAKAPEEMANEKDTVKVVQQLVPCIKFTEHFDGHMNKGAICSAGPLANYRDRRAACHGCDIFWETVGRNSDGRLESSRISRQNKYAFSVFDYGKYHKLEQYDRESGKVKVNSVTKEPYFNWVKCQGQGCDACKAGKESKDGNMSHWPVNYTHFQVLRDAELEIGKSCTTCGTVDSIISRGWMCGHCGECAVDMDSCDLKQKELLEMTDNPYQCPSCDQTSFLKEVYECRACSARGQTGVRATLFDVNLRAPFYSGEVILETAPGKGCLLTVEMSVAV